MANKNGVVSIGLNVDYQKSLQEMTSAFKSKLTEISKESKKLQISKDVEEQIGILSKRIDGISTEFRAMFDDINNQKIDASKFEAYQAKVTKEFEKIEKSISGVVTEISALDEKVGMLSGADIASSMKKQFDELKESVLDTYQGLEKVFELTKTSSNSPAVKFDKSTLDEYKKTLALINKLNAEATKTPTGTWGQLKKTLSEQEALLQKQLADYDELKAKMASISPSSDQYLKFENELVRIQAAASATADKIQSIFDFAEDRNFKPVLGSGTEALMLRADNFGGEIDAFEDKVRKMIEANKEAQNSVEQAQTAFNTFTIKNGAIHVPVEVATKSGTLQKQLQETIDKLQEYAQKNSIIAKVKLTLDSGSASGYKKNEDITKQIEEGQSEPGVDISKAIKKTYVQAVREAEKTAKDSIKAIQAIFDGSPVKITPNKEAFAEELSTMVSSSLGKIANDTTGLNVNQELEKLVANLKEVSTSLSGNENFKFGLDEASIERITAAIKDMADMIQRAFGVASNDDITAQWGVIESKFKAVAKENGSIDLRLNKNKEAMRELAVEYKKYLDMGGKEKSFSDLTSNSTTVDRLTEYYKELGKAAKEAAQQQEKATKKPASTKVSSEEKEAIKGVTKQNKNLEEQAVKTGTALDNEGKKAQSAAEKFRKLAKEKGAAVVANRELAKAAKETADALEREARIRKETGTKTGKGAVDELTYADNFSKWQREIKQSLVDSGNYAEVYDAKVSQASNGTVKFTAVIRDLDGVLKKFSAKVNDAGKISSPSISDMSDKQAALFEKRQRDAQKVLDAMAAMEGGAEKPFLDRTELEQSIAALIEAEEEIDRFKIKKVSLEEDGKLAITTEVKEANGQVKTFVATFDSIGDIIDEETGNIKEFVDVATGELKSLGDILENKFDRGKFTVKMPNVTESTSLNQRELWQYLSAIEKAAHELENADTKYSVSLGSDGTVHITKEIQKANGEVKIFKGEFKDINDLIDTTTGSVKDLAAALRDGFDSGKVTTKTRNVMQEAQDAFDAFKKSIKDKSGFKHISDDLNKLEQKIKEIATADGLEKFNDDIKELRDRLKSLSSAEDVFSKFELKYQGNSNWSKISAEVEELRQNIASIDSQGKLIEFKQNIADIVAKLNNIGKDNKLGKILDENKTFGNINEVRANIDSLFASMGKVNEKSIRITGTDKLTAEVKSASGEIRKMAVSLDSNDFARFVDKGIVEFGRLRNAAEGVFKGIQSMVRIYLSPQDFIRYFRQGFDAVREIDTAMTELKKVSDASAGDIAAYFDTAATSAKELGSSINEMIGATADWSRMGKSLPDSKELAEVAILYKNVGDNIDVEEATSSLVSTLQGFQMDAKDAIKIVDSFNEVANNYAINSDGIGESLKRSAAAFNAANTDLNKSIALIAATRLKIGWIYGNIY